MDNDSDSVWVKVIANKTSHFVASWYRPPDRKVDELELFKIKLKRLKRYIVETPLSQSMFDFNFRDIIWPDRLNKQGSSMSMSEGIMLVKLINYHELERVVHFPTRGLNTLDLIITSLPGQFVEIHSPTGLVIMALSMEL